jgi:hypothetical protein
MGPKAAKALRKNNASRSAGLIGVTALAVIMSGCASTARLASDRVDASRIRQIRLDMAESEVTAILGQPFSVERVPYRPGGVTMNYTKRAPYAWSYPMLWVHLSNGRVVEVYAKLYQGFDDRAVYALGADRRWESAEFGAIF